MSKLTQASTSNNKNKLSYTTSDKVKAITYAYTTCLGYTDHIQLNIAQTMNIIYFINVSRHDTKY
jgi:hypothetical protein